MMAGAARGARSLVVAWSVVALGLGVPWGCSESDPAAGGDAAGSEGSDASSTDVLATGGGPSGFADISFGGRTGAEPEGAADGLGSEGSEDAPGPSGLDGDATEGDGGSGAGGDTTSGADSDDPAEVAEPEPCEPLCGSAVCGPDGCGGLCGQCAEEEICSDTGTCDPDPSAGCGGLELAEDWSGEFDGDIVFTAVSLLPIEASTSGDMTFSITCFNSKFIVNGQMSGEASDNPFTLTMAGTYNPTTKELKANLSGGSVTLYAVLIYEFEGEAIGTLGEDGSFDGTWSVAATGGSLLGGPIDLAVFTFDGEGIWSASPVGP